MDTSDLISLANPLLALINAGLFVFLIIITRRYANATDGILEASRTASYGTVYIWAVQQLSDEKRVKMRETVITKLPKYKGPLESMPDDLRIPFEETCRTYDAIAIAGHNGMLPMYIIAKEWGNSIINTHEACERFMEELRSKRGKMFWDNYTQLYHAAKKIWK